jgi:pimeloyl-ACP methyl ester carboxylesterase
VGFVSRLLCLGDVSLHYTRDGKGEPVVFVHGGGTDLTYWDAQIAPFAERYHVIAYSRRYAEPNRNAPIDPRYSARTDGRDLAALITALELGAAHVVAHSIGAVAALFCATEHPELVQSLVVAEPPVLRWAHGTPEGDAAWAQFVAVMWEPAAAAFRAGQPETAMRIITDSFAGPGSFGRLRPTVRTRVLRNARDWEAFTLSEDAFPPLDRGRVAALTMPVLMLSAERTVPIHRIVDDVLAETLPGAERVRVPEATHDLWSDQPEVCRAATLAFLERQVAA